MPNPTRAELLGAATAFCDSFAQKKPLEEILSHFSSAAKDDEIVVHEHGLMQLAPFLGRDFCGREGVRKYFEMVARYLSYEDIRFVEFIADDAAASAGGKVGVRGKARFTWKETDKSWDETFVYVLGFDITAKLTRYEVWADTGAAYLASRGEL
ncbi:transcription elongation factor S-II [Xylaria bambusicola]|uniref:transcription elongation factor S-II n=1 Tax=Xylaria bambusicola TaxID=326684 RepID=UPI0020087BA0|nr:transcription elongation factor S-II [Xylaria bambusicola]KAI0528081.1 transcription elongation factor S-II [Xylaria bambusicola]